MAAAEALHMQEMILSALHVLSHFIMGLPLQHTDFACVG